MFKNTLLFILSLLLIMPVLAQDNNAPAAAVEAALTAVEEQVASRAGNFTYQFLGESNDSSLGCPLVQGEELAFTLEVILVEVIYPDTQYNVYTSISGQIVILCDAQFGEDVIASQIDSADACTATPIAPLPAYIAPNITLNGVFTAGIEAYPIHGVSSDGGWYQVASDTGLGWIEASSATIAGNCDNVPTTSVTNPTAQGVCFVTAQAGFTNMRSNPEGELVGRIYENEVYQVSARNTAATWFYIQPAGWVSNTVIFPLGDCNNITVNDNAVGVGFTDIESGVIDTDAAVILERFACPGNFAGYLIPRIVVGSSTAQVSAGTIPNTLRAYPSVDDAEAARLGVIQPLRVIDRVISGPACNQGFVWWLVEIDGLVGWTAESNQSSNDYFLEPAANAPVAVTALESIAVGSNPVIEIISNTNGSRLFTLTGEAGFGDGIVGVVIVFDGAGGQSQARIEEPTGIVDVDYAVGSDEILVAAGNGTVTLYNTQTLEQSAQQTAMFNISEQAHTEIMPDSSFVIVASCTDENCNATQVNSFNAISGAIIASVAGDSPVLDLDISADGSTLAVLTANGVDFYSANTLTPISNWENSDGFSLNSVVLNQDGSSALFAGCNNVDCNQGRIGLLTVADASLLGVVPSHTSGATLISYNNDFTRFVTVASDSGEIIERSATTGDETQRFDVSPAVVSSLSYTADGGTLAAGTSDGNVIFLTLGQ